MYSTTIGLLLIQTVFFVSVSTTTSQVNNLLNSVLKQYMIAEDLTIADDFRPQCRSCDSTSGYNSSDEDECEPVQDEAEGCTGDDEYRRCVTYFGDHKEVTEHSETILEAKPLHGESEIEDATETYEWSCESKEWEAIRRSEDSYWHRWANGNVDSPAIFPSRKTWENWDRYTHKEYDGDGFELSSFSSGSVQTQSTDRINNTTVLIEDTNYTYTEPPTVREGYSNHFSFDNQGRWTQEKYETYKKDSDGLQETDIKIKERYNNARNPNGMLNKCKATWNGRVVFDQFCPFPSDPFEEGLV